MAYRHPVREGVNRLLAQLDGDPYHEEGDAQRGEGVGLRIPELGRHEPGQDHERGVDVAGEVEGVRLQGRASRLLGHPAEGAAAREVHHDGHDDHAVAPGVDIHMGRLEKETLYRLVDDPHAREEEKERFEEGRDVLNLLVTVGVVAVRRPFRDGDRPPRHDGREQVEPRMGGLREDAQAPGEQAHGEFSSRQEAPQPPPKSPQPSSFRSSRG